MYNKPQLLQTMAPCCLFRLLVVRNTNFNYKHTSFGRLIEQCMVDCRRFYVMPVIVIVN